MLYSISNVVVKSSDWKVVSIQGMDGSQADNVSVNKVNKKGEIFPDFDSIADGSKIEANFWMSDSGKGYLFAPRPIGTPKTGGVKSATISQAMDRKEKSIGTFQDKKENSIAYNVALNTAHSLITAMISAKLINPTLEEANELIKENRDAWLAEWDSFLSQGKNY